MSTSRASNYKYWKAVGALALIIWAIVAELNLLWGVLFILWGIVDFRRGSTMLLEEVSRKENPSLFYTICCTWLIIGIYIIIYSL